MNNARLHWEDEHISLLADLWRKGLPKKEIASQLGRTIQAVERMASNLKLPHRHPRGKTGSGGMVNDSVEFSARSLRAQDLKFIQAMLDAGYVMSNGRATLNSSGSSR